MNDAPRLIAALDTSAGTASFAVLDDAGVLRVEQNGLPLSRASAELCDRVLAALGPAGLTLGQIRHWLVGMGPGSFTGIRVGAALVEGVCAGTGAACQGVPSSLALVRQAAAPGDRRVTVLHDGCHGDAIVSDYRRAGADWDPVGDARALPAAELDPAAADCFIALNQARLLAALPAAVRARAIVVEGVAARHFLLPAIPALAGPLAPVYVRPAVFVPPVIPKIQKP